MENASISNYKKLANQLAKVVNENKILMSRYKDCFRAYFIEHVKNESLKEMQDCLQLFHMIELHQDSNIKLECGTAHCIECYYFFSQDSYFNPSQFYCTCMKKITARYRFAIISNYERIQSLKKKCIVCNSIKDEMNFPALRSHKTCAVCYSCIEATYIYSKGVKNNCRCCFSTYDSDSEFAIRTLFEQKLTVNIIENFYLEHCDECKNIKDSRQFSIICQDKHNVCKECVDKRKVNRDENCFCGLELTILIN